MRGWGTALKLEELVEGGEIFDPEWKDLGLKASRSEISTAIIDVDGAIGGSIELGRGASHGRLLLVLLRLDYHFLRHGILLELLLRSRGGRFSILSSVGLSCLAFLGGGLCLLGFAGLAFGGCN